MFFGYLYLLGTFADQSSDCHHVLEHFPGNSAAITVCPKALNQAGFGAEWWPVAKKGAGALY